MAAVYESLPGKRLTLLKLLTYFCRYRPNLTVYLVIELYHLFCVRKCTAFVPGLIAIIIDKIFSSFRLLQGRGDWKPQAGKGNEAPK